jgi:ketosteroid isomerase-like protein
MSNVATVKQMYASFAAKDADGLRAILHPEVEWIQCAGMPGGAHRHGPQDVIDNVMGGLNAEWQDFDAPIEEYIDGGDSVVALGHYTGTHRETGQSMKAVFAHVYDVKEGRITRFRQYTDTYELVKAMSK